MAQARRWLWGLGPLAVLWVLCSRYETRHVAKMLSSHMLEGKAGPRVLASVGTWVSAMPDLLRTEWLWVFGAFAFGVVLGWLTYLRAATRWTDRPVHIAVGVVAVAAILAIARLVPSRFGIWLDLGVILSVFYAAGCIVGWALRDLAEFVPAATTPEATASAGASGTYLFRGALAGAGAGPAYMRATTGGGSVPRQRPASGAGALTPAPAPGGYTFPKVLPFADATTSRRAEPATGMLRHWSWRGPTDRAGISGAAAGDFAGSKGGYVFPPVAAAAPLACGHRDGTTRAGLYRHWTWRGAAAADPQATASRSASGAAPAAGMQSGPISSRSVATPAAPPAAAADGASADGQGASPAGLAAARPAPGDVATRPMEATAPSPGASPDAARPAATLTTAPAAAAGAREATTSGGAPATPAGAPASGERSEPVGGPAAPMGGSQTTGAPRADVGTPAAAPESSGAGGAAAGAAAANPERGEAAGGGPAPLAAGHAPSSPGGPGAAATATVSPSTRSDPSDSAARQPMSTGHPDSTIGGPQTVGAPPATVDGTPAPSGASDKTTVQSDAVGSGAEASASPTPLAGMPDHAASRDGQVGGATGPAIPSPSPVPASPGDGGGGMSEAAIPAGVSATAGLPAAPPSAPGQPATIAAVPGEEKHSGERPEGLMTARDNRADDLKRVRGIGPRNEGRLHGLGIWHFDQIAAWTPDNVRWVGSYLAFPGRIDRETWVEQARVLAGGGDTAFSQRMLAGKVASSIDDGSHGQSNVDAGVTSRPRKPPR